MTLHVTNGDATVIRLAEAGIDALPWRDALHEGPVVRGPERRALRARFLGVPEAELEARDRALDEHAGDYVLWFEADLYDQLQIAEILHRLRDVEPARIALRQAGEHVGIARFAGLPQLTPEQLLALPEARMTAASLELAQRAFEALIAPEPTALLDVGATPELRFMGEAFVRLAQEYPWRRDGLSLTERRLLAAAPGTRVELFLRAARKEARPFLGDSFAFQAIERLAPLLRADGDVLQLTEDGERVLAGEAIHITERWIGGVHVTPETPWRWDEARERIVA
jgi:hypothetical protein